MRPPIVPDLPIEDYHSPDCEYVSSTFLRTLLSRSPAHAVAQKANGKDSEAMKLGRLAHTMLLEPEKFKSRYCVFDGDFRSKENREHRDRLKDEDIELVKQEQVDELKGMVDYLNSLPIIQNAKTYGMIEPSYFWQDQKTGVLCKARPDIACVDLGVIMDMKTTTDALPEPFQRQAIKFNYALQASMQIRGFQAVYGKQDVTYLWLVVEKEAPFGFSCYQVEQDLLQEGEAKLDEALATYKECLEKGEFPNIKSKTQPLGLPEWMKRIY
jgi:hypothetical protein